VESPALRSQNTRQPVEPTRFFVESKREKMAPRDAAERKADIGQGIDLPRFFHLASRETMCRLTSLLAVLAATLIPATPALKGAGRQAFIVGAGNYDNLPDLKNPSNDAILMAETLKKLDFEVYGGGALIDPGVEDLKRAFLRFSASLAEQTETVIFFAGHGLQLGGENLLIPADFDIPSGSPDQSGRSARLQCLTLTDILSTLEESRVALSVVLLDCCRDPGNLVESAGFVPDTGLAEPKKTELGKGNELLIGFAAKHGHFALDGTGANSPFTEALASRLVVPGTSLRKVLEEVTAQVMQMTDSAQQPFFYGSLTKDIYLAGTPSGREMLVNSAAAGIGAPDTVDKLVAALEPGNGHSYVRKLLGEPRESSELKATIQGRTVKVESEVYETDIYQLELLYLPPGQEILETMTGTPARRDERALLAFVMRISHDASAISIYRGSSANTLFILGRSTSRELWEQAGPGRTWFNECARTPRTVGSFYFGRGGHYLDWLVPAPSNFDGELIPQSMKEPFRAFGVMGSTDDDELFQFVARRVAPPF